MLIYSASIFLFIVNYMEDKVPVESLAFPYIFWNGRHGTYNHNGRYRYSDECSVISVVLMNVVLSLCWL